MTQRCVGGLYYQKVVGYNITKVSSGEDQVKFQLGGENTSNLPYLLSITNQYYAKVLLHNINCKRGEFISNEIYISLPGIHDTKTKYFQWIDS